MSKAPQIQPAGASPKINLLVYAWPGAGKTTLAGSSGARTLIIRSPVEHLDPIYKSGADEWVVRSWADMLEAGDYLRTDASEEYDWVWLDSISIFQDVGLDDIWADTIARSPHRAQYGPDKGEYGINMHRLALWVRHVVGLKAFHFGITAHPAEFEDVASEEGGAILKPWVQGKNMSDKICGYMNVVAYLEVRRSKKTNQIYRVLRVNETERYYAKDQFNCFPAGGLVNPTIPKIVELIGDRVPSNARPARRRRVTRRSS